MITREQVRASLAPHPGGEADDRLWIEGATPEILGRLRAALPARRTPAAVLVPLVERPAGLFVLLTQRAATLKDHAGQISFPGGRIEPEDASAWHAALRESHEEIGLKPSYVEFAGYMPDHVVITGFQVTPVVGFVDCNYHLSLDAAEVHDAFEVPLDFILDSANHKSRTRVLDNMTFNVRDIPYQERNIWGATANMLMTLRQMLHSHSS